MKIVADEGIERPIVLRLRAEGHQVIHIAEIAPGTTDPEVLRLADQEEALLITYDKDFGDLIFYRHHHSRGVVLLRLPETLSSLEKAEVLVDVITEKQEHLFQSFTVVTLSKRRTVRLLSKRSSPELD